MVGAWCEVEEGRRYGWPEQVRVANTRAGIIFVP